MNSFSIQSVYPKSNPLILSDSISESSNTSSISKVTVNLLAFKSNVMDLPPLRRRVAIRSSLKVIAIINSGVGRIPFFAVAKNASSNPVFGYALAVGNVVSWGALLSWASFNMIDAELALNNIAERNAVGKSRKVTRVFYMIKGLAATTAVVSMLSWAYVSYKNNGDNLIYPIITILSDSILPGYSLWLSAEALRRQEYLDGVEEKIFNVKGNILIGLANCQNALLALLPSERTDLIASLNQFSERQKIDNRAASCMIKILSIQDRAASIKLNKKVKWLYNIAGFTIMSANLFLIGTIGYHLAGVWTDNEWAKASAGTLIAASTTHMYWNTILKTPLQIFTSTSNFFCRNKPLAYQLRPKLTLALELSAVLAASLGWGPTLRACEMYYSGKVETTMAVLTITGVSLMLLHALSSLASDITKVCVMQWGEQEEKDLLQLHNNLQQYQTVLRESSIPEFARFLKVLSDDESQSWMKKTDMNVQILDHYLAERATENTLLLEAFLP